MKKPYSKTPEKLITNLDTTANVAAVKDRLSHYLSLAKKGQEVIITEHKVPIAKIVPFQAEEELVIRPAKSPPRLIYELSKRPGVKSDWDVVADLLEDRKKR